MKAIIIAVGDELTSGQAVDSNSAQLACKLGSFGIETLAHWTVGDDRKTIAEAISTAAERAELVLITGGLGPTADDLTRQALADALGSELVLNEMCLEQIEEFFRRRGRKMIPANRIQAMIPAGAEPLANHCGTAPGIAAKLAEAQIFAMPGVPEEMDAMFERSVAPLLPAEAGVILHHVVSVFGTNESEIDSLLSNLMERCGPVIVGTTVRAGIVSVRIASRAADVVQAERQIRETVQTTRDRLGNMVVGEGDATMASVVGGLLRTRGLTLAVAESCTGGLIGETITAVAGSSDYYLGGVIAYADTAKVKLLGVSKSLLAAHGAASKEVACAMAIGCRERLKSDWAVSVTGIAGPTGGSEEKPVGLVYIGLASREGTKAHKHIFPGTRELIRFRSAHAALNYLRLALMEG
ncbi:MAG: competence/damage-inducible protein A [Phycisphaerae bacterium]|nr:competence/damage-inducible protein A [Phycisphaerae bacterium]